MKVVYWSSTGNTERMAQMLADELEKLGVKAELEEVSNADPEELKKEEIIIMGCPAMGDEELEEGEMEPFVQELEKNLSGKKVGLFGSYDWGDGEWMRRWEERMQSAGAEVIGTVIANNEPDEEAQKNLEELAGKLIK